jgi:hypothetical protein
MLQTVSSGLAAWSALPEGDWPDEGGAHRGRRS